MKSLTNSLLSLGLLGLLTFTGCNKNDAPRAEQKDGSAPSKSDAPATAKAALGSAEKSSFQQVTAQLDPGGNLYFYLGTEQWLDGLAGKVSGLRSFLGAIPDVKDEDRENLNKAFNVATNLIKSSGLEDVSGLGVSSIATEKGFYHSKTFLHHYKGKGSGFLWTLFGDKAHALDGLSLLPTNTAFAMFSDLEMPLLWQIIQKQAAQSGFPQAEEMLNKLPEGFEKATGLKWDKVLASLGGEYGLALTLDAEKKISLPLPGAGPLDIPAPALMLVAKVKDDAIFNRIDTALKATGMPVTSADKPDLKMRTVAVPLPLPIQLSPSVAVSGGYLFISTSDALIQEALAVKSGKAPGLKSTAEFLRLAKDTPPEGNSFSFLSQRFGQTLKEIQRLALSQAGNSSGAPTEWLQSFMSAGEAGYAYSVAANTDEGWLTVVNGNQHPAKWLLAAAVVPAAMGAGLALPALAKAKGSTQKNSCISNLRMIDSAKQEWALEKKKAETDTPSKADLLPYIKSGKFLVCPEGGEYAINAVSMLPRCSISGHTLPEP